MTVTLQTAAPPPESAPLDLVIAIDDSGSLNATNFNLQKEAAVAFVSALDFTGGVRKVGVIKFADIAETVIDLTNDKSLVVNAINGIVHELGATNITDAIRDARTMITGPNSQPGADKVLLLMTDGQNNRETTQLSFETGQFKAIPGEIFALGFGSNISVSQLNSIASDPDSTHVFVTPDATELSALATEIAETIQNPAATDVVLDVITAAPFSAVADSDSADAGTVAPIRGNIRPRSPVCRWEGVLPRAG